MRFLRSRLTFANVASALALFIALSTGAAYAANTIGSSDVIDESLLSQDIKNGQVQNADLAKDAVAAGRLADGAVIERKLADNAVTSAKVAANTLTGDDVKESSLDLGGFFAAASAPGSCAADVHTPTTCASTVVNLGHSGRLLVNASGQWNTFNLDDVSGDGSDSDDPTLVRGTCGLVVDGAAFGSQQTMGEHDANGDPTHPSSAPGTLALTGLSGTLAPGSHTVQVQCTEVDADLDWSVVNLTAARAG